MRQWLRLVTAGVLLVALIPLVSPPGGPPVSAADPAGIPVSSPFGIASNVASRYGIYGRQDQPIGLLASTGARWMREEFVWQRIQPRPNTWDWAFTDEMADQMARRQVQVVGMLCCSVGWASGTAPSDQPSYRMPNLDAWANFVFQTVNRYKTRIRYWELWNEEDNTQFWQPEPDPAQYARVLRAGYQAVKRADPGARVLMGATSGVPVDYLEGVVANGGWDSFDILAVHPYVDPHQPETGNFFGSVADNLERARAFVARHGGGKPIWATEIGWSTAAPRPGGKGIGSEETAASFLVRGLVEAVSVPTVEKVFWYSAEDAGTDPQNDEFHYGLLRGDWRSPKPAFVALSTLIQRLAGAAYVGPVDPFASTRQVISGFETTEDWYVWAGGNTAGLEPSAEQTHSGSRAARVTYGFNAYDYVEFVLERPIAGQPTRLGLWAYGDNSGRPVRLLFIDATGQEFTIPVGTLGSGWQRLEGQVDRPVWHGGGAADGVPHYPIRFKSIQIMNLSDDALMGGGTVYFDDLYAEDGPELYAYRFARGGGHVDVVWLARGSATVSYPTASAAATVFDREGRAGQVAAAGGVLPLQLGTSPVFVEHVGAPEAPPGGGTPSPPPASREDFVDPELRQLWQRTDDGAAMQGARTWYWGPAPWSHREEQYLSAPGGRRLVQYFDKARMEVTNPAGDRASPWFVTTGLLVKEMVSGRLQLSDGREVEVRRPAELPVAGDPLAVNPSAPTYSSFTRVASVDGDHRAPNRVDQSAIEVIDRYGNVGVAPEAGDRPRTRIAAYEETLGHNIPAVFWDFLHQRGPVFADGVVSEDQLVDWTFAMGLPISEPYWANLRLGGKDQDVLIQLFERRVLTYVPTNPPGWEVEMGNVGQHYFAWRYPGEGTPWTTAR